MKTPVENSSMTPFMHRAVVVSILVVASLRLCGAQQASSAAAVSAETTPATTQTTATVLADGQAVIFMNRCAGCHTIGGGLRTGPDLMPSTAWKREDLAAAVKRMEKNTGPLSNDEVDTMVLFLRDASAKDRIAKEETRRALIAMAQLEPASPQKGRDLFFGKAALANRGPNCAACHSVGGLGGNLGPDLTAAHAKFGDMALASAIEKTSFRIMAPIYGTRPVTRQESVHLSAYLAKAAKEGGTSTPPAVGMIGGAIAGVIIAALAISGIRRRPGIRSRLVEEANRR
jgi:mono/diheme cytochrome c family protein